MNFFSISELVLMLQYFRMSATATISRRRNDSTSSEDDNDDDRLRKLFKDYHDVTSLSTSDNDSDDSAEEQAVNGSALFDDNIPIGHRLKKPERHFSPPKSFAPTL